ncbi:hypothetical protein SBY92_002786 [Candida maltosa Xu316]|uniref:RRM domain-containing protein n=1 Tax=Candida maltosa (strain Xu316) TaxID=1245528 RepID=M3JY30_CANMX|nr:hypothetical protein G210_2352 [Candida maltosa Xu316]
MAKKQTKSKVTEKVEKVTTTPSEKSIEEIEEDLQLPSSSDDEEEQEDQLSEESEDDDEDEEIDGLSSEEDDDEDEESSNKKSGHSVNKVIKTVQETKSDKKKSKQGIIYIGRLPDMFQEKELKTYFKQFGDIINLKLSRNKKTGKSKHYGYIEFDSYEVAKVAADTMNNYLLFGHLIKCHVVEEAHNDLFKGANKKFKVIPWSKIAKDKHEKPRTKEEWKVLVAKFEQAKKDKVEELKSKGIDFDLSAI